MHEHVIRVEDSVVVTLADESLREGLAELRWGLDDLLADGEPNLIIDVSGVERLSSATIAGVLWVKRACRARQVRVVIRHPTRRSWDTLRATGLVGVIDVDTPQGSTHGWSKSLRGAFCA